MKVDHLPFQRRKHFIMQRTSLWKRWLWQKSKYEMKDWFEFTHYFLFFPFSCTMPLFLLLDIFFSPKKLQKNKRSFVCSKTSLFSKKSNIICSFKRVNMFVFSYFFIQQSLCLLYPVFHPFLLPILVLIHRFFLSAKIDIFLRKKANFLKSKYE